MMTKLCVVVVVWQAIVFMVGGGNYIEYQNLVDYCKVSRRTQQTTTNMYACANVAVLAGTTAVCSIFFFLLTK